MNAAGPTTSIRVEPYQGDIIRKFRLRAVIGKVGMGTKTLAAMKDVGAVYLSAIGGAAQYYAKCIEEVEGVDFMEFQVDWHSKGLTEAEYQKAVVQVEAERQRLERGE